MGESRRTLKPCSLNFKDLLDDRGLSQQWYDFENTRQAETIRQWCKENEIKLIS